MNERYSVGEPGPEIVWPAITRDEEARARLDARQQWRDRWPWRKSLTLPPLPLHGSDVQVFVRLNFGPAAWQYIVTLNGQPVNVPIALDPQTQTYIGLLPVPTLHVTVRWVPQGEVQPGVEATLVEVTTE
jgi:hypothetical protein